MDWMRNIKTFHHVIECNSFAKAAASLHTTPSVISKRVAWLEEELGIQILRRTTRKQSLTQAGNILYARTKPLLSEWNDVKNELTEQHENPKGFIRIGMPAGLSQITFSQILIKFINQYPEISVEQRFTQKHVNILEENVDMLITHFDKPAGMDALHMDKLINSSRKLYASQAYIERYGVPSSLEDLKNHNCLLNPDDDQPHIWHFQQGAVEVSGNFYSSDFDARLEACKAGAGIIYASVIPIIGVLENQDIFNVLPELESTEFEVSMYYPDTPYLPKKDRIFIDFILEGSKKLLERVETYRRNAKTY